MSDHNHINYYNAMLPLYIFLLIFFIVMATQSKVEGGKIDEYSKLKIQRAFKGNNNKIIWKNFFRDIAIIEQNQSKNIDKSELNIVRSYKNLKFKSYQNIQKDYQYEWSVSKDDIFQFGTEYFNNDYQNFLQDIMNITQKYEDEYILRISWFPDHAHIDQMRINSIYTAIKNFKPQIKQILLTSSPYVSEKNTISFSLISK